MPLPRPLNERRTRSAVLVCDHAVRIRGNGTMLEHDDRHRCVEHTQSCPKLSVQTADDPPSPSLSLSLGRLERAPSARDSAVTTVGHDGKITNARPGPVHALGPEQRHMLAHDEKRAVACKRCAGTKWQRPPKNPSCERGTKPDQDGQTTGRMQNAVGNRLFKKCVRWT